MSQFSHLYSKQPDVNVTANLLVNVYGLNPVNFTIDLCSIFDGALCPLPMYNFIGNDAITLPGAMSIEDKIPGIAFRIPDLEGFVQLILTEIGTGNVKACVQSTLSNGWSTYQPAVMWSTGMITLAVLLFTLVFSILSPSFPTTSVLEFFRSTQFIALSCLLSLNYPSAYRSFCLNFSWSFALFPTSPHSSIQQSINRMRNATGAQVLDNTGSAIEFVNRQLSPYNAITSTFSNFISEPSEEVQTVTPSSPNVLQAGLPIYVNSLGIVASNVFMSVFLSALTTFGVVGFVCILFYISKRYLRMKSVSMERFASIGLILQWALFTVSAFVFYKYAADYLSKVSIFYIPLLCLSFYQWTIRDSWLSALLSVIVSLLVTILFFSPLIVQVYRKVLVRAPKTITLIPIYVDIHRQYRYCHTIGFVALLPPLGGCILVAFGQNHDAVQLALFMVMEISYVLFIFFRRSSIDMKGDRLLTMGLSASRVVVMGLMISFIQATRVAAIPRTIISFVISVILSVTYLFGLCYTLVRIIRWWSQTPQPNSPSNIKEVTKTASIPGLAPIDEQVA